MQTAIPIKFFARQKMVNTESSINILQALFERPDTINNKTVFVIDDSETSSMLIKIMLNKIGIYNVYTFTNPDLLIEKLYLKPDLIITDIEMSVNNIDGIILYQILKRKGFNNILFITAYSEAELKIMYGEYENILKDNTMYKPIYLEMLDKIKKRLE